ncbi:hypothetical protein [Algoriphagus sp.]|uniref:hypothetical protein n=1 Tax=Algoriphagus sp. TaxID=1872435 RepID=UPI00262088E1|nr:hypothetical protein [Algoriphagus sp.]
MIERVRSKFNAEFSHEKYAHFLEDIEKDFGYRPTFRIAETPFFIPKSLEHQLIEASQHLIEFIQRPDFKQLTQRALNLTTQVPNEDSHTQFLAIDFGICEEAGVLVPKLIEVQGFASIFNFQLHLFQKLQATYPFLTEWSPYLSGLDEKGYLQKLKQVVLNGHQPEEVVLLDIQPEKQNTKIDFYYCHQDLGIPICCVTDISKEGKQLYYINQRGEKINIKRIYNRVIFDELESRKDLKLNFSFTDVLEVEWAGHPNWYSRISKFILPYLKGPYFIESTLLSEVKSIPKDLENYVLKPLFSFSGSGVVFNLSPRDIELVREKDLFILQKKVNYLPLIQSPDGKVKVEVRILALWPEQDDQPTLVGNLVRLSRGEMIGVKFNQDKDWVGGSIGLFQRP